MQFKKLAGAVLAASLVSSAAFADIQADLDAKLTTDQVLQNALAEGMSLTDIMAKLWSINPALVDSFVSTAITQGLDATEVVAAAIDAGADPDAIGVVAIAAGADPQLVTAATAAGPRAELPQVNAQGFRVARIDAAQGGGTDFAPGLQAPAASPN